MSGPSKAELDRRFHTWCVDEALRHLRIARRLLTTADCPRARERVRLALKSTEGARRNVQARAHR